MNDSRKNNFDQNIKNSKNRAEGGSDFGSPIAMERLDDIDINNLNATASPPSRRMI